MRTDRMLMFLAALEMNNSREWFRENQDEYKRAKEDFEALLTALTPRIRAADPAVATLPADRIAYRLMRDTRFSQDKSPYNPSFRAHFGPAGKLPVPCGYFLCIRPGDRSFLAGGLCRADLGDVPFRIRTAIDRQGGTLAQIEMEMGLPLLGDKAKRMPAGFPADHPQAEYLKLKQWYVKYPVPDKIVLAPDTLIRDVSRACERMRPLNDFLNRALEGFPRPVR